MNIQIRCKGCGAILQNVDSSKMGYVKEVKDPNNVYCKRCFRLKHYNELPKILASKENYEAVIDDLLKKNGLIVYVVDLLDLASTFVYEVISRLRDKNVILVGNKYDVFPHSSNPATMVERLAKMCEKKFFKVDAVHLVSSKKGYFLDELMNTIDLARKGRDVYFVGCANVGKSSLINALLKRNTSRTDDVIATSVIPGTTLDQITIPFFEDNKAFIDTPGLINEANVLQSILPQSYLSILPKVEIKPKNYQLLEGNAVLLAGLGGIILSKGNANITVYTANSLYIHRCKASRIPELFKTNLGDLLTPPTKAEVEGLEYKETEFVLPMGKHDVCFPGIGFICVSGDCTIKAICLKKSEVYTRDAFIGTSKE